MSSKELSTIKDLPQGKALILFDGYCNLCNGAVQFVLKRDKKEHFYFAGLSWPVAGGLLNDFPQYRDVDSILVYQNGKMYSKSSAALIIAGKLGALWPLTGIFWPVPKFIRNGIYQWVARNRYKWFGKKDTCMMPEKDWGYRFFES